LHNAVLKRVSRLAVGLVVALLLAASSVLPAAASNSAVALTSGNLYGGGLTFSNFSETTVDGNEKTTTASWTIANVVDGRGSGAGWNLSLMLTAPDETGGSAYVSTAQIVSLAVATSSQTSTVTPVGTNASLFGGGSVKILQAAIGGGMGSYAVSAIGVTLTIPTSARSATYLPDAIVSLSSGP
jgi:hypothetical protein